MADGNHSPESFSEIVEAEGHLIDSRLLAAVFDKVIERRARFDVLQFSIGRTNEEFSQLELRVTTDTRDGLRELIEELIPLGCHPRPQGEVRLAAAGDGFVAKRFNQVSELGRFLDPVADKALLVSIFLTLGQQGHVPSWIVILVVSRDAMIIGGALFSFTLSLPFPIRPHLMSKANTAAQIVLAGAVLGQAGLGLMIGGAVQVLIYLVAATTLVSGGLYLVRWMRSAMRAEAQ